MQCRVVTEVMPTWRALWRQRMRWQRGALENIGAYGLTRATLRYWLQQIAIGYGTIALNAYLLLLLITLLAADSFQFVWFWALIGLIFVVERVVTVWAVGWRGRAIALPLRDRDRIRPGAASRLRQVAFRHRHRPRRRMELRPPRIRSREGRSRMTILAGILLSSDVLHTGWFQALAAFVAINTLDLRRPGPGQPHPTTTRVSGGRAAPALPLDDSCSGRGTCVRMFPIRRRLRSSATDRCDRRRSTPVAQMAERRRTTPRWPLVRSPDQPSVVSGHSRPSL